MPLHRSACALMAERRAVAGTNPPKRAVSADSNVDDESDRFYAIAVAQVVTKIHRESLRTPGKSGHGKVPGRQKEVSQGARTNDTEGSVQNCGTHYKASLTTATTLYFVIAAFPMLSCLRVSRAEDTVIDCSKKKTSFM